MEQLTFRPAVQLDKPAILGIAAQTWEGDDYIPDVVDDWLTSRTGQLIVAELEGRVVGLARYDRTFPGYAWFEGLRVDAAYQGRGIARAITGHLVERAQAERVERMGLSTYYENIASQKASTGFRFTPVAGFAACSAGVADLKPHATPSPRVEVVPMDEAIEFVRRSEALAAGEGFLPHSWRFYPFARGPHIALAQMEHRLGIRQSGKLAALLLVGNHAPHGPKSFSLDFLEGDPALLDELVRHAFTLLAGEEYVEAMVPCRNGQALPTLVVLRGQGFKQWNDGKEDVLLFERAAGA